MNREVNLTKRIRLADGSTRFCPAVLAANGRVKPDYVLVDGKPEHHPEGRYYVDWTDGERRVRRSVGTDANAASAARHRQEQVLASKAAGIQIIEPLGTSKSLVASVAIYLDEIASTKKPKTHAAYKTALDYFTESCTKASVQEIQRADLLKFSAFLRGKKLAARTVANKFENVMSFLKAQGIRGLVGKNDWPKYTEEEPEIYPQEELGAFFKACNRRELVCFKTFLMTGFREQEIMHLSWRDVNFKHSTIRVSHKPDFNWTPKAYKVREVPAPDSLMALLKDWNTTRDRACVLVFPNGDCNPDGHLLRQCKDVAERAELNSDDFWLHKFRATFATWHLWAGVDLRTVQLWMGHTDMESTLRYLKPNRSQEVRDKVNLTFENHSK
jgi:integrase/recombinase XerD